MTSDRKKPTAGFWITVALVVVLVGYPASYGPWTWLVGHTDLPSDMQGGGLYSPLFRFAIGRRPAWLCELYVAYLELWERD